MAQARRRRTLAIAAVAAVSGLLLASCSSGGTTSSEESDQAATTAASATAESAPAEAPTGVTLTLWHNSADSQALLDMYKRYEQESGNTLELVPIPADAFENTTQSKWAAGDRPDILEYHGLASFAANLNPAENLVDLSGQPAVEKMGSLSSIVGNVDGKNYAVSIGFPQVFGYYYNKALFEKAGLQPPTNYDELLAACDVIKEKLPDIAPVFSAAGSVWPTGINTLNYMSSFQADDAYGKSIVSGEAKFTDPDGPMLKALNIDVQLREKGCFNENAASAKFEDSMAALFNGETAMVGQHSDMIPILNELAGGDTAKVDETIGFIGISADAPTASYAATPFGTYYVPKNEDPVKEQAAIGFLDWITGAGYAQYVEESGAPAVLAGAASPELQGLWQDVATAWTNNPAPFFTSNVPGVASILIGETAKLVVGEATPEEVAQRFQAAYEQAAAASGS